MKFIIVTGMSGAGKSSVLRYLEDIGFFCVDNLPPLLIPKFAEMREKAGDEIKKVAVGIDIRGGSLFDDLFNVLDELSQTGFEYEILFLEASNTSLLTRFKETRRSHPLGKNERIETGIEKEREILQKLKSHSDYIIDTTHILPRQLKEKINDIFIENKEFNSLMVTIMSFGFKYGIPKDSDLVFDVRFLPNPFYLPELKHKTGNESEVSDYVMESNLSQEFLVKLEDMISFLIPHYVFEGKNQLVISIGCTGGKHRSVTLANELFKTLQKIGHSVIIYHRDIDKDAKRYR